MFIKYSLAILAAVLVTQPVFADEDMMGSDDKPCATIVKACVKAGYKRHDEKKKFWKDCMQPVVLGKTVTGVDVKADDVKACRSAKIERMEKELSELKAAQQS